MILMAALLTASIAQAAEPDDTVTVYNAHKVTVVSNDSLLQVEVDGTDRQPDYHYQTTLRTERQPYHTLHLRTSKRLQTDGRSNL